MSIDPSSTRRRCAGAAAVVVVVALIGAAAAAPAVATNDPLFPQQWGLDQIGAASAWPTTTGQGVKIGIVDTGVDTSHPDLAGKIDGLATCLGGTCREGSAPDRDGHGTAVAGVAAATADNGAGIAGVAPGAQLIVAKALGDDGGGTTEDINAAIQWVVDHGARVVNLSLGDPELTVVSRVGTPLRPAIEYAWSRGAIPVLAAGNYEPGVADAGSANYGNLDAVVVGATDKAGAVAEYSTSLGNAKWGLVAPGGNGDGRGQDILAPAPGGRYAWVAGTSFAAPHVTGALALLLAQGLTQAAAVDTLLSTLDHSSSCGDGCRGRLRVDAAVAAGHNPVPAPSPIPSPAEPAPAHHDKSHQAVPAGLVLLAGSLVVATAAGSVGLAMTQPRRGGLPPPLAMRKV